MARLNSRKLEWYSQRRMCLHWLTVIRRQHMGRGYRLLDKLLSMLRSRRLFGVACCRMLPLTPKLQAVLHGVETRIDKGQPLEHGLDFPIGRFNSKDLVVAAAVEWTKNNAAYAPYHAALYAIDAVAVFPWGYGEDDTWPVVHNRDQIRMVMAQGCVMHSFVSPSLAIDPEWRTSTTVALAGQMYESNDFSALPILADALQDAGCNSEPVLRWCRSHDLSRVFRGNRVCEQLLWERYPQI